MAFLLIIFWFYCLENYGFTEVYLVLCSKRKEKSGFNFNYHVDNNIAILSYFLHSPTIEFRALEKRIMTNRDGFY